MAQLNKIYICITLLLSIFISSASVSAKELSNNPCNDLYNKIIENTKTLQNRPYDSAYYFGFEIEPTFIEGNEDDGLSYKDELDDYLLVTFIPNQNINTFYTEDENGSLIPYIKSLDDVDGTKNLKEGDLIYSINGQKINSEKFYDAWNNIYYYYGKNYSFYEYLRFDFVGEDLNIDFNEINKIKLGIIRPSDFDDGYEYDIVNDLITVEIESQIAWPIIDSELELDITKILEINSKDNNFTANYEKKLINWDKYKLAEFSKDIFGDNEYWCSWSEYDEEYSYIETLWKPSIDWTNRVEFDKDRIKKYISISYFPKLFENNCPCAIVTFGELGIAKFQTYFDYRSFPFDQQELSIHLVNYGVDFGTQNIFPFFDDAKPKIIGAEYIDPSIKRDSISGWFLEEEENYQTRIIKIFDSSDFRSQIEEGIILEENVNWDTRDTYTFDFTWSKDVKRQWVYYLFKIIGPLVLILMICWSVFWTPSKELESRLTVTITCFLALVAYTFVIDDDLPQLSYLTLMDYIILVTYFFASLPTILSIVSYNQSKKDHQSNYKIDFYSRIFGPVTYIITLYLIMFINVNEGNTLSFAKKFVFL